MRRPLPPELIALGDRLEAATARALARRRARRQLVLNAVTSLVVAVPLAVAVGTQQITTTTPVAPTPTAEAGPAGEPIRLVDAAAIASIADDGETLTIPEDFLPRDLRRMRQASLDLLVLPSSLRPALR